MQLLARLPPPTPTPSIRPSESQGLTRLQQGWAKRLENGPSNFYRATELEQTVCWVQMPAGLCATTFCTSPSGRVSEKVRGGERWPSRM